jgi:acyl-CoA thioesterase-1
MLRSFAFLILAVAGAFLTGCRADSGSKASSQFDQDNTAQTQAATSGPSDAAADSATPNRAAHDARPLVVCFGDSLTAGYGADDGESYPDFLQKDLDDAGYHYRVVNEGVSGNTTKDGVDRLSEVKALHPAVVVLEFGGNDGLRGIKVQTMRTNLATMIAGLQQAGAKVVLAGITLPPDYGPDYVTAFTNTYPQLARKYDVPVLPFLLKNVYGIQGLMQGDNIHATDRGNAIVAKNILPLVEPLLKK